MVKLPVLSGDELIKLLKMAGFEEHKSGNLPRFVPYGGAGINLMMQVFFGDLCQKLFKRQLRFSYRRYYKFPIY